MEIKEFLDSKNYDDNSSIEELSTILEEFIEMKTKENNLRILADLDNIKKRSIKEKSDMQSKLTMDVYQDLLTLDNELDIALKRTTNSQVLNELDIFSKKLSSILLKRGIIEIDCDTYDPNVHEVIHIQPTSDDKRIEVVSKGYTVNGKIVKYPKVVLYE